MAQKGKQKGKGGGGPKPVVVEVQAAEPTVDQTGGTWSVLVTAIVSQDDRALAGRGVQFYANGRAMGSPAAADPNGRAQQVVHARDTVKHLTVEAQAAGAPFRGRAVVTAPEKKVEDKPVPTELVVDPWRVSNDVRLFVLVLDQNGKNIPRVKLTIADSSQPTPITDFADDDGEYSYSFTLTVGEEREIAIYVAGFGEEGFRETFRGRK